MKVVGVLGGMGPEATVDFISKVIAYTDAACDQDHIPMIVEHRPSVPNRQKALLGQGEDPSSAIGEMGRRLESAGADFLVMPCNSAHAFIDTLREVTRIPLISIIDATVEECSGFDCVGVLATDGCLKSNLYQSAFQQREVNLILPTTEEIAKLMRLIVSIKSGDRSKVISDQMVKISESLWRRGAQAVVAGCTEIPLVLDGLCLDTTIISSTDALARRTVNEAKIALCHQL